jgi:5-(carboxyamino)imidazole ribonucleotide synthase
MPVEAVAPCARLPSHCTTAQQRARRRPFSPITDSDVPFARALTLDELWTPSRGSALPPSSKTGGVRLRRQGPACRHHSRRCRAHLDRESAIRRRSVERLISLQAEVSVVAARGVDGSMSEYPVFENRHRHHILDVTTCPAEIPASGGAART